MKKKIIETSEAPAPIGPYSQAVEWGNFVFCSGQIPVNPQTGEVLRADVASQAHQVMKNIQAVLAEAGLGLDAVLKTTIYLDDMSHFGTVNEVYASYFSNEPPARSCVEVSKLPKDVQVEIEVIAARA